MGPPAGGPRRAGGGPRRQAVRRCGRISRGGRGARGAPSPQQRPPMTGLLADARLHAVAGWDVPLVRRVVAVLAETADRLFPWRARLEGAGRALEAGDSWS